MLRESAEIRAAFTGSRQGRYLELEEDIDPVPVARKLKMLWHHSEPIL